MKKFVEYLKSLPGIVIVDLVQLLRLGSNWILGIVLVLAAIYGIKSCSNGISNIAKHNQEKNDQNLAKSENFKQNTLSKLQEKSEVSTAINLAKEKYGIRTSDNLLYVALIVDNSKNKFYDSFFVDLLIEEYNNSLSLILSEKVGYLLNTINYAVGCSSKTPECPELLLFLKEQGYEEKESKVVKTSFDRYVLNKDKDFLLVYKRINPAAFMKIFE